MTLTARSDIAGELDVDAAPVYLDCNASTPMEPAVVDEVLRYMTERFGNAGSRTHRYGQAAKERVNRAREEVAEVVAADPSEVVFTSGATEANNLAILGLGDSAIAGARRHVVTTAIEHKAVLEPVQRLAGRGFDVTVVRPTAGGWVDPDTVKAAVRPDTLLVSVMAVNNETGVEQPIAEIAAHLGDEVYLHVDAAQAFGKLIGPLQTARVDLISASAHKVYGPQGVGALIARRRGYRRPPIQALATGGGQERGLRPGTLPVALIAGFGLASRLALSDHERRAHVCAMVKRRLLAALEPLDAQINGDLERAVPHTLNFSLHGVDSEAAMLAVKDMIAVSNGSACTSQSYEPSHVLTAMGLPDDRIRGAMRVSWSHMTPEVDWAPVVRKLRSLL